MIPLVSLIVPTLNRPDDLARCLRSVERTRPGFDEIIIVDQGDVERTRRVVERFPGLHATILPQATPSLTRARNRGVERARGDYIVFIDDDSEIPPSHVAAALACFHGNPRAVGVTGPVKAPPRRPRAQPGRSLRAFARRIEGIVNTILLVQSVSRSRVLRSGSNSPAVRTHRRHDTQWLPGCHCAFRRRVFDDGLRFPTDFIGWGFGEDVVFSYQVYKRYGAGSLRFDPAFTSTHHPSPRSRHSRAAAIRMMVVYRFLFWYREVRRESVVDLACYLWGQLGFVLSNPLRGLREERPLRALKAAAGAYRFLLKHWRAAVENRIDYNHFILHGSLADGPPDDRPGRQPRRREPATQRAR